MKIGDKVIRTPITFIDPNREKDEPLHKPMVGKVVYIHPQGRFHTVEFQLSLGTIKECFTGV